MASGLAVGLLGVLIFWPPTSWVVVGAAGAIGIAAVGVSLAPRRWGRTAERLSQRLVGGATGLTWGRWIRAGTFTVPSWIVLGFGQWLMIRAMNLDVGLAPVLLQPLANVVGMFVPIAPGGLGVREGVMVGYLGILGVEMQFAMIVAAIARFWSLSAELIVFLVGLCLVRRR